MLSPRRAAALLLAGTLLTGCDANSGIMSALQTANTVIVEGSIGSIPVVTIPTRLNIKTREKVQEITGSGRELTAGGTAIVTVTTFDARGDLVKGNALGVPKVVTVDEAGVGEELANTLVGQREGSRIVLLEPVEIETKNNTLVTVVDILPTIAQGNAVKVPEGLPALSDTGGRVQAVAMNDTAPPADLVVAPVIQGGGAQVKENEQVIVRYTATRWASGEVIAQTETDRPIALDLLDAMPGLRAGILDQRVGSRLLLVVPPEQAAGTETVVLVVDILAAFTPDPLN